MTIKKPTYKSDQKLWQNTALLAGAFSFVICMLIIVNYIQINRINPVETQTIDALVNRLNTNPDDQQLREQIRTLDLLARKAYFTNQWQIRMGGYLLFIGVIMVIISMQMLLINQKKNIVINPESKTDLIYTQKQTRRWISGFSAILVSVTLVFAFLTYRQLGNKFVKTLVKEKIPVENIVPLAIKIPEPETKSPAADTVAKPLEKSTELVQPDKTQVSETATKAKPELAHKTDAYTSNTPGFEYEIPFPKNFARNFSTFRGPGGNGISFQKNIPLSWDGETGENILWKTEIPLKGFNSPIIWDDKVFLTGATKEKREVYCFDGNNGKILWATAVENIHGSPATAPVVPDYTGYAAPTGATDGKHVYVIFANADVAALDFEGKMVWGKNLGVPDNHYGYSSSLLVYHDNLIVQWDQRNIQKVMALSTENGTTVWETERDVKISWASPVIASTRQGPQLILAADPYVISYNPETGKENWKLKCLSGEVGPSVAVGNQMVFALNEYASLVGIKLGVQPEKAWEDYSYLSDVPSPVATNQYLFVSTSYGVVACFATATGEMLWETEFDNSIYASPVIADGKVYLIDKQGITHIFKTDKEYHRVAEAHLGEGCVCTPAFSEGRIYIRGEKHLFCIGEK